MAQIKKYTFIIVALVMVFNLKAQETKSNSFSLQQAIEYALKNSPNIQNAELDKLNAIYKKNEIFGLGLPQVNGSIDFKDYLRIPTSLLPGQMFGGAAGTYIPVKFGTKYNATAGISASQLIFSSDYLFGLKASDQFVGLYEINLKRSKVELITQVSKAYYTVLVNQEKLKYFDANLARVEKTSNDYKAYYKEGLAEQIDVERWEVQLNNLKNEKEKVEKLIGLSLTALKFQMGYKLSDDIQLADKLDATEEQNQEMSLSAINIKGRSDLQLLQAQQVLNELDVKRLKYGYLPTLAAYGSFQYNAQRTTFNLLQFDNNDVNKKWFPISLVGLTLNMNLFDGLQRHYKIEQAKMASQKSLNNIKNLEMAFELEANAAIVGYNNAITSMKIQKKNMDLAQHIVEVANKKFQVGVGNNLDVVFAEASLKEAQTNYYNALFDLLMAKVDYQKATGALGK
ncbi:MAG: TolC family protein [Bacteroidota bacterium]